VHNIHSALKDFRDALVLALLDIPSDEGEAARVGDALDVLQAEAAAALADIVNAKARGAADLREADELAARIVVALSRPAAVDEAERFPTHYYSPARAAEVAYAYADALVLQRHAREARRRVAREKVAEDLKAQPAIHEPPGPERVAAGDVPAALRHWQETGELPGGVAP